RAPVTPSGPSPDSWLLFLQAADQAGGLRLDVDERLVALLPGARAAARRGPAEVEHLTRAARRDQQVVRLFCARHAERAPQHRGEARVLRDDALADRPRRG